jgi:ABC-type molybdate transport system permease subunit
MSDKTKTTLFLIGVYVAMIAGMASKTCFNCLTRGTSLDMKEFLLPLLISPLVYGTVFRIVRGSNETILMLIFGFQNGFFWQDIFGQLQSHGGGVK